MNLKRRFVGWADWVDEHVFGHLLWWDSFFGHCPAWWWNQHVCKPIATSSWWEEE